MLCLNSYGVLFKVEIFGESHGQNVGVLLDGVPTGIPLQVADFHTDLARRKPQKYGTPRKEDDEITLATGVNNGYTTGAPLLILFANNNIRSKDYAFILDTPRPSHADLVAKVKYRGYNDINGGGHFSGRLTLGLVAAGVVAKKIKDFKVKATIERLKDSEDKEMFAQILEAAKNNQDSVGGIIKVEAEVPVGLGEPFFDSVESVLSHLIFSVPAIKGVSFGSGFRGTEYTGSEYNDLIVAANGQTKTNHDGGINGGITNGNKLEINVAVKPTPSIGKSQSTYSFKEGKMVDLAIAGRHDTAIILRMPVILEAVVNIGLVDLYLRGLKDGV